MKEQIERGKSEIEKIPAGKRAIAMLAGYEAGNIFLNAADMADLTMEEIDIAINVMRYGIEVQMAELDDELISDNNDGDGIINALDLDVDIIEENLDITEDKSESTKE